MPQLDADSLSFYPDFWKRDWENGQMTSSLLMNTDKSKHQCAFEYCWAVKRLYNIFIVTEYLNPNVKFFLLLYVSPFLRRCCCFCCCCWVDAMSWAKQSTTLSLPLSLALNTWLTWANWVSTECYSLLSSSWIWSSASRMDMCWAATTVTTTAATTTADKERSLWSSKDWRTAMTAHWPLPVCIYCTGQTQQVQHQHRQFEVFRSLQFVLFILLAFKITIQI